MGLPSKFVTIACALTGLAVFSQAPEFAQQYRQRIGGAVEELKAVVVDFDEDASNSELSRQQALEGMKTSPEHFTRDRGESMTQTIGRFERLNRQQIWLESSHPLSRPLLVFKDADGPLLNNAWEAFEPALPINTPGILYGGIGAFLALLTARLGVGSIRRMGKRRNEIYLAREIERPSADKVSGPDDPGPGEAQSDNLQMAKRVAQSVTRTGT